MEHSTDLREFTLRFYEAMSTGDVGAIEGMISPQDGVILIGSDPDEWWANYGGITRAYRTQMEEMGGGFTMAPSEPQAYSEGSVGWVADRPKLRLEDGTEVPFRLSAVFHKEEGQWKIVQTHFSIGVSNEEAVGRELTI